MADLQVRIVAEDAFSSVFSQFNNAMSGVARTASDSAAAANKTADSMDKVSGSLKGATQHAAEARGGISSLIDTWYKLGGAMNTVEAVMRQAENMIMGPVVAASNQEEALNKLTEIYKNIPQRAIGLSAPKEELDKVSAGFDLLMSKAEQAAQTMGMSKTTYMEFAGTFGNLFTSMNLPATAAAELSSSMLQLGTDLASFNNPAGGVKEALDKIRSGLVGEFEPLRAFGVNLNSDKIVDAFNDIAKNGKAAAAQMAAQMGMTITDANGKVQADVDKFNRLFGQLFGAKSVKKSTDLDDAGKALASYYLIMQKTSNDAR